MDYETALDRAQKVLAYLRPFTKRCEIAGSIRRKKQTDIKDIEVVAEPIFDGGPGCFRGQQTLIPNPMVMSRDMLGVRVQQLLAEGIFGHGASDKAGKRAPCGPRYYRLTYDGEKLDLFSVVPPAQWGTVFLIRTGDADFSHWYVTRLHSFNLHSIDGHIEEYGSNKIIDTKDEEDCFRLVKQPYVAPEDRTLEGMKAIII